jgi:hypothetical protein
MRTRRYEVQENSPEVKKRVGHALFEGALASLSVDLADIYEGELPIPPDTEHRELMFSVLSIARVHRGNLKAYGFIFDDPGAAVSVTIPKDEEERSVLSLVDTRHQGRTSRRRAKKLS